MQFLILCVPSHLAHFSLPLQTLATCPKAWHLKHLGGLGMNIFGLKSI